MSSTSQRKISQQELTRFYQEELLTDLEIANKLDCTQQAVYKARKKFGIRALTKKQRNSALIQITPRQEEIIRGSLLGDAWIERGGIVGIAHGNKQFEYVNWLAKELQPYFGEVANNRTCRRVRSCAHKFGDALYREYYKKGTKIVTQNILDKLTPLSLAVWFMDDGQVLPSGNQARLATCCFTRPENDLMVEYFQHRWGITGSVRRYGDYDQIYFNKDSTRKLVSTIRQHVPMCMRYKLWATKAFSWYLSGGMEYKKNLGSAWRDWITEELEKRGQSAINPIKLEPPGEDGGVLQHDLTDLKLKGKLGEVRELVRSSLFRKDMVGIQQSDGIIVYYDESVQKGAGTLSEAWESFREGRPVYVVSNFPLEKIPTWLIGETTQIFYDLDEFLEYVDDHSNVIRDMMQAQRVRDEVLGGIY